MKTESKPADGHPGSIGRAILIIILLTSPPTIVHAKPPQYISDDATAPDAFPPIPIDQLEPEDYYRLLECGFRFPINKIGKHPIPTSGPTLVLSVDNAMTGDILDVAATKIISIKARVISRDPIGKLQIISNNKVLAEIDSPKYESDLRLEIPAVQSRWIVARCSNKINDRNESAYAAYTLRTKPGHAHTNPIFVNVAGYPRFDPTAAASWQDQLHNQRQKFRAKENIAKENIANGQQLDEAVEQIERRIRMLDQLKQQVASARNANESWSDTRDRMANVILDFDRNHIENQFYSSIRDTTSLVELRNVLQPLVLFKVSINPESRVKIEALSDRS